MYFHICNEIMDGFFNIHTIYVCLPAKMKKGWMLNCQCLIATFSFWSTDPFYYPTQVVYLYMDPNFYFYKMGILVFTNIWCWRYMQSEQNHLEIKKVGQDMRHVDIHLCFFFAHGQEQRSVFCTLVCAHTWQGCRVKKQMMELEHCVTLVFSFFVL